MNARITKKSFKRWKMFSTEAKKIFKEFDLCLSASTKSSRYLKFLGAKNIKIVGNLKFTESENIKDDLNKTIKKSFLSKKIWCASSTHNEEELICAKVHKKLKIKHKNLLTILIPRHIDRATEISEQIKETIDSLDRIEIINIVDEEIKIPAINKESLKSLKNGLDSQVGQMKELKNKLTGLIGKGGGDISDMISKVVPNLQILPNGDVVEKAKKSLCS
jgi:3-deoxy-D-manno-octulosonic-acid transferase